ncbi:MAG: TolB family protein [Candidatus Dormibacteraceae bacterium]
MISRFLLAAGLAVLMVVTAVSSYMALEGRQSKVAVPPAKPTAATPPPQAFTLPGTLYLAQSGALYSLSSGRFHQLTPEAGWSQPAATPNGDNLLAVRNFGYYTDVYELNRFGTATRQLTANAGRLGMRDPSSNHWSFYPRLSLDGSTLWMTYDGGKCSGCLLITFDIWAMPVGGTIRQGRAWTNTGLVPGGDVQPIPVPQGGIIYTQYNYDAQGRPTGQLWYTNRANSVGRALTDQSEDCRNPALSPSGTEIAMICTYVQQVSFLTIASWNGSSLGPRVNVVTNQMVAQPTWAPDGSGIAYLAPAVADGPFQLWFLPKDAYAPPAPSPVPVPTPTPGGPHNGLLPTPSPTVAPPAPVIRPIQVTTNDGFDATSPLAWLN